MELISYVRVEKSESIYFGQLWNRILLGAGFIVKHAITGEKRPEFYDYCKITEVTFDEVEAWKTGLDK